MQSLSQICHPRQSIFDPSRRDTVLDLKDLVENNIDTVEFFKENYITAGMKTLLEQGFRRLTGKSEQGVFLLKQAMGGGKTHSMLVLGLLAKHPELRAGVMGPSAPDADLGEVQVVAFSGRESDAPLGVWGAIAEQLGVRDHFKEHYSPLRAPGQGAWHTLLKGRRLLILLDELPPYFENAYSISVGDSNLAAVTATALSNLLVAINRDGCERICLVITDLVGAYEKGSAQISSVLRDLGGEANRSAMSLEPVRMGGDELYHILRIRLFSDWESMQGGTGDGKWRHPDAIASRIDEVAQGFSAAIRTAKQMDITAESPEQFADRVATSYPFHPSIRDLYARFRENPGYQQTRGLIRLMRIIASRLWASKAADRKLLISAYDVDFNDPETLSEIGQINSTLNNAITHDIASNGSALAEVMDANLGGTDTQDAARLLLMSSLSNVQNAIQGLAISELVTYLCAPGRDLMRLKSEVLEKFATGAWYLHSTRDNKLYFRNVQNLNARLEDLVRTYAPEQALKEVKSRVEDLFKPNLAYCYQRVLVLPALDEIEPEPDRVTLVVFQPAQGDGLSQELRDFWKNTTWQNRLAFLTGARATYGTLLDAGKRLRAVDYILGELKQEGLTDTDPQMAQARTLAESAKHQFNSAVRETFTQFWYPGALGSQPELFKLDFPMVFEGGKYDGEKQILALMRDRKKFEDDISSDAFRLKVEQRLFNNTKSIKWSEVKERAAMNPRWQWTLTNALDDLKKTLVSQDAWRESGGYIDRGPFPEPATDLVIKEIERDATTGAVTVRVTPVRGDIVYYDIGGDATTASEVVDTSQPLVIRDPSASFLVVDSTGAHEQGPPIPWKNIVTIKHRFYDSGSDKMLELTAAPPATIQYTTSGADPRAAGATYSRPFVVPPGAVKVRVYATVDTIESAVEEFVVPPRGADPDEVRVDLDKPARWNRKLRHSSTKESYEYLGRLKKYRAQPVGVSVEINGEGSDRSWVAFSSSADKVMTLEQFEKVLESIRETQTSGQVHLSSEAVAFAQGLDLLAWVEDAKLTLDAGEVKQ